MARNRRVTRKVAETGTFEKEMKQMGHSKNPNSDHGVFFSRSLLFFNMFFFRLPV